MREAMDWLNAEHRLIGRVLASLGTFLSGLDPAAPDTRRVLGEYVEFFLRYVEGGHERVEEEVIFSGLAEYGGAAGPVALLAEEHRQRAGRLAVLAEVARGEGPLDEAELERLSEEAGMYSSHLRSHILKEDRALLPLAETLLPEEQAGRIAADLAAFTRNSAQSDLVALAESLVERYPPLS